MLPAIGRPICAILSVGIAPTCAASPKSSTSHPRCHRDFRPAHHHRFRPTALGIASQMWQIKQGTPAKGVRPTKGPKLGLWIHVTLFDDTVRLMTPNSMEATWPKITHPSFTLASAMDADDSPGERSSSDEADIHGGRLPTRHVQSQLRPARSSLSFVSLVDFDPDHPYDENPPSYIRYGLEWTLRLNQKKIAFQTEPDVVLAPNDFWNHTLRLNLENEISKLHQRRACQAETTSVNVSVNARGEEDLTRRFDGLGTTWSVVEERLRRWSRLLFEGKKIRIKVVFDYTDTDRSPRAGVGRGATASQLAERSVRLDAEQAASGSPDPWRQVYGILSMPRFPLRPWSLLLPRPRNQETLQAAGPSCAAAREGRADRRSRPISRWHATGHP